MAPRITTVIPSRNPRDLLLCLTLLRASSPQDARVIVVGWGDQEREVGRVCNRTEFRSMVTYVRQTQAQTLTSNRNLGLSRLLNGKRPTHVAFLDDDAFVEPDWFPAVLAVAAKHPHKMLASCVVFANNSMKIQTCGHKLCDGRPLDVGYQRDLYLVSEIKKVMCPCANSSVVPWELLEKLRGISGGEVWDTRFRRMSCLDFGLRARLLGYGCVLVRKALVHHDGYLTRPEESGEDYLLEELTDRLLLYEKFYPAEEYALAYQRLEISVAKWKTTGHPHARKCPKEAIAQIFEAANERVSSMYQAQDQDWIDKAYRMGVIRRRRLLLGSGGS